jgi:hypothetical protein
VTKDCSFAYLRPAIRPLSKPRLQTKGTYDLQFNTQVSRGFSFASNKDTYKRLFDIGFVLQEHLNNLWISFLQGVTEPSTLYEHPSETRLFLCFNKGYLRAASEHQVRQGFSSHKGWLHSGTPWHFLALRAKFHGCLALSVKQGHIARSRDGPDARDCQKSQRGLT